MLPFGLYGSHYSHERRWVVAEEELLSPFNKWAESRFMSLNFLMCFTCD
jgi:hypothetical protein